MKGVVCVKELLSFASPYVIIKNIIVLGKGLLSIWIADVPGEKVIFLGRISADDALNVMRQIEEHWYDIKHDLEMETL